MLVSEQVGSSFEVDEQRIVNQDAVWYSRPPKQPMTST